MHFIHKWKYSNLKTWYFKDMIEPYDRREIFSTRRCVKCNKEEYLDRVAYNRYMDVLKYWKRKRSIGEDDTGIKGEE